MEYFCDGKVLDFSDQSFTNLSSKNKVKTKEGICYEKDGKVYKIYYNDLKDYLLENACEKLTKINLKHIFLPTNLIYSKDHKYCGYEATFIEPLKEGETPIVEKSTNDFFIDIDEIEDDKRILEENKVLLGDVGIHNMIDNGHINIFDAGDYKVSGCGDIYTNSQINKRNCKEIDLLIRNIIIEQMKDSTSCELVRILSYLDKKAFYIGFSNMLKKETKGYNSIKEYCEDVSKTYKKICNR